MAANWGGSRKSRQRCGGVATLVARGAPSTRVFDTVAREVAQVLELLNAAVCRYDDEGAR